MREDLGNSVWEIMHAVYSDIYPCLFPRGGAICLMSPMIETEQGIMADIENSVDEGCVRHLADDLYERSR